MINKKVFIKKNKMASESQNATESEPKINPQPLPFREGVGDGCQKMIY